MKKKIMTAVLGICLTTTAFGGILTTQAGGLSTEYTTKVVPIISIGTKGYIGAAQVTGPASSIEQVKAVAQVEGSFNGMVRVKGLVPVDSTNPVGASRVQGVGVSALIDLKI